LMFQVMEITDKVVVCVNLMDEARRKGIDVDLGRLSAALGVPAVGTNARGGVGLADLVRTVSGVIEGQIPTSPHLPTPPGFVQALVADLVPQIQRLYPKLQNARWIAYRLIEGDNRIRQAFRSGELGNLGHQAAQSPIDEQQPENAQ